MWNENSVGNGEKELPFCMNHIPDFFRKKCEMELNETDERKKHCIDELKKLLKNDSATHDICFQDDLLVQYLRHSKYNIDKAVSQLRNLNVIRKKEVSMFQCIPDEYFITKQSTKYMTVLPKRCLDGCTIVLFKEGKWDPNELEFEDCKRLLLITFLQLLRDPMTQINGIKFIHDFAGTGFEHLKYCTPRNLYLFYHIAINCIPGRYKEFHLLNETLAMKILWSVIKRFVTEKIKNRVFFHTDTNHLLNYFPKSVLPVEYGGDLLELNSSNFVQTANQEQQQNTIAGQPNFY